MGGKFDTVWVKLFWYKSDMSVSVSLVLTTTHIIFEAKFSYVYFSHFFNIPLFQ
jgi:hypothetical protein